MYSVHGTRQLSYMSFEIEATYENGLLKPDEPLPLRDRERVVITVRVNSGRAAEDHARRNVARQRLVDLFAQIDEKTQQVPDKEMDSAIEEALHFVRSSRDDRHK
jgi:predicted DNA-binding antitoxin AbrB/MazE fold protein